MRANKYAADLVALRSLGILARAGFFGLFLFVLFCFCNDEAEALMERVEKGVERKNRASKRIFSQKKEAVDGTIHQIES